MFDIRLANREHARGIAKCITLSFGESASIENIARIITQENHYITHIALSPEGQVAGFVDAFQTTAQDNTVRHEIDLLAVHPEHRRQGIARRLVQASCASAKATTCRALVAADNIPMQNNMRECGFQQSKVHALYTSSATAPPTATPAEAHLIPVDTLTYNGIWLEGTLTPQAITAALHQRTKQHVSVVGAVIPTGDKDTINLLQTANFTRINTYHWWHIDT